MNFLENAHLLMQNEAESVCWQRSQVTLFTAHVSINQDCKESDVIISDDLNLTKNAAYTFM